VYILLVSFLLIPAFGAGFLFAEEPNQSKMILSVEFAADDFEALRLFNEKGSLIPDPAHVSGIQAGWIIQTENTGVELYSKGTGTLYLSPSTLISVDLITEKKAEFFLLKGKLRFVSESDNFPVYISTPAADYTISTPGEYILLSENTENFYVLEGKADVFNRITQQSSTIEAMVTYESLNRKEPEKSFVESTAELLQETLPLQYFTTAVNAVVIPEPTPEQEEADVEEIELEPVIIAAVIDEDITANVPDENVLAADAFVESPADEEPAAPIEEEPIEVIAVPSTPEIVTAELIVVPEEESGSEPNIIEIAVAEPEIDPEPEFAPVIIEILPPTPEPDLVEALVEDPIIEPESESLPFVEEEIVPIIVPDKFPGSIDSLMPEPKPQLEEILLPEDEIIEQDDFPEPIIIIIAELDSVEEVTEPLETPPVEPETETFIEEPIIIIAEDIPETAEVSEDLTPDSEVEIIVDEPIVVASEATKTEEAVEKPEQPLIIMAEPVPIVTTSYEPEAADGAVDNVLTAGVTLGASSIHTDQSTVYKSSYLKTVAEPWINYNNFSIGLHIPLIFEDYPLSIANWYLPRGNNPYDFGTGYSSLASFEAIRDLSLDILSLIGYANYRSSTGSFLLNADDHTMLSMGTGALVSGLDPMIDNPFIRRVGFKNTLTTPYFDYELLINDITHAELFGLRLAAKPMGQSFPMEIGLYALSDVSLSPNKFIIVPGIDIIIPLAYSEALSLNVYTDFSLLMLADETGLNTDTLFTDGFLAVLGARGKTGNFSFALSGAYQNAMLTQGLFSTDYSWRRAGIIAALFDDEAYTLGGPWAITAEIGYDWGIFDAQMSYQFNFDENFGVSSWDENRDEISFSAVLDTEPVTVELGLRQRGFASSFSPSGPATLQEFLFNERTQLFAGASYTNGSVTVTAELSGSAQYQDTESSTELNNIDDLESDISGALVISPTLSIGTKIKMF